MIESSSQELIQELKNLNLELAKQNLKLQIAKEEAETIARKLNLFFDISPLGHYLIDVKGKIIDINNAGLNLLGKSPGSLNDINFNQFIVEKSLPDFNAFLKNTREKNGKATCDIELIINEKEHLFLSLIGVFLEKEECSLITSHDNTKKEELKKKIRNDELVFGNIQRIGNIGSFNFNLTTDFLEFTQELRFMFGFEDTIPPDPMKLWLDIVHPQDREMMKQYLQECISNQTLFRKEYRIIRRNDGEVRWVDGWGEIIFDDESQELSMIGIIQDITERKLAVEKIQNAETRSHQIFESSKEGILILDAITGQITDANPFLIELIGYNYNELVGKELWEIGVFKNIAASKENFIELQNKEYIRFEDMPLETKDGNSIDVEFVSNVYKVDTHKVILCHIRDISDRKKTDKVLQESAQLYYAMFEKNQTPQLLIDPINGEIIDVNSSATRFYGYSLEAFKLMTLSDIGNFPSEQILEEMKKFTSTGPSYFQFIHKLASGETCDIEMYTSPLSINGRALLNSTINDISKRKLEEERMLQLNNELKEVNVLKSQFISTVSHEFRTPLAGILSSVQLLQIYNDTWDKEKKEKQFKQIFDAVQHTKALLDDVSLIDKEQTSKSFFRPTNIQLLPLINEIIEENISVCESNQNVILQSKLEIQNYHMDPMMIRHIFNNIISNAIKYSRENKEIIIYIDQVSNKMIKFVVKDHGIGIPQDEIKYLLEPFYRASNRGAVQGTGFGLSIVKRFIDLHKGKLIIESVLNKGTVVTITLPYLQEENE